MQNHDASPLSDFIEYQPAEMLERSEQFYTDIKRRHSIRKFSDRPVTKTIIENCIKAAGTAPNGANMVLIINLGTLLRFIHNKSKRKYESKPKHTKEAFTKVAVEMNG
jgi:nitroreductase